MSVIERVGPITMAQKWAQRMRPVLSYEFSASSTGEYSKQEGRNARNVINPIEGEQLGDQFSRAVAKLAEITRNSGRDVVERKTAAGTVYSVEAIAPPRIGNAQERSPVPALLKYGV